MSENNIIKEYVGGKYVKQNTMWCLNNRAEPYLADNLFAPADNLFMCEGYHDALAIDQAGYPAISVGTCKVPQSFIDYYHHQIKKFRKFIVIFDSEESNAGLDGLFSFVNRLIQKGLTNIYIGELPRPIDKEKIDISELLCELDEDRKKIEVQKLIKEAKPLHEHLFSKFKEHKIDNTPQSTVEKEEILADLYSYLLLLPKIIQIDYEKKICSELKYTATDFKKLIGSLREQIAEKKQEYAKETTFTKISNSFIKELWRNEHNECYASVFVKDHIENLSLDSEEFKNKFICHYFDFSGTPPSDKVFNDTLSVFKARALKGKIYTTHLRVAQSDSCLYVDVCNEDWDYLKITKEGISKVSDYNIKFIRYNHMKELRVDLNGDQEHIDMFFDLFHMDKNERQMLEAYIITLFFSNIPSPIWQVNGPAGSSKSTIQRLLRGLIDPSSVPKLIYPKEENEILQQVAHHYLPLYDNLGKITSSAADIFCMLVTGAGVSKRKLYTNSDDYIFKVIRKVSINGINVISERSDFLDRTFNSNLQRIPKTKRKTEKELDKIMEDIGPKITGAFINLVQKTFASVESVHLKELPRLADFAVYAETASRCIGYPDNSFMNLYFRNIDDSNAEALQGSITANVLIQFVRKKHKNWADYDKIYTKSFTSNELLNELKETAEEMKSINVNDKYFPKTGHLLSKRLNEVVHNLEEIGIKIKHYRDKNNRYIEINARTYNDIYEEEQNKKKEAEQVDNMPPKLAELFKVHRYNSFEKPDGADDLINGNIEKGLLMEVTPTTIQFVRVS